MTQIPVTEFKFRLSSRSPDDVLLSQLMAEDLATRRVNLSGVIKSLLLAWYQQRLATGEMSTAAFRQLPQPAQLAAPLAEDREDINDPLVQSLLNLSFEDM
jgi:hypothetical protein